jgi:hypothetical protein
VFTFSRLMFLAGFFVSLQMKPACPLFQPATVASNVPTTLQLLRQLGTSDFWMGVIYATNAITQFLLMNKYDRGIHQKLFQVNRNRIPTLCVQKSDAPVVKLKAT